MSDEMLNAVQDVRIYRGLGILGEVFARQFRISNARILN